ncbi:MAG: hypothetical protein AAGD43_31575 [Pseudomonadota bacterium]
MREGFRLFLRFAILHIAVLIFAMLLILGLQLEPTWLAVVFAVFLAFAVDQLFIKRILGE